VVGVGGGGGGGGLVAPSCEEGNKPWGYKKKWVGLFA